MELMEWSKEETIRFIETYRKRDLIWNPKHSGHYNKLRKQEEWQEIANENGRPVEECKKKMEYLLSAMRREKMKMNRNPAGQGPEGYRSSWFAFDSMKFIWDKHKSRPTPAKSGQDDRPADTPIKIEPSISWATLEENSSPSPSTERPNQSPRSFSIEKPDLSPRSPSIERPNSSPRSPSMERTKSSPKSPSTERPKAQAPKRKKLRTSDHHLTATETRTHSDNIIPDESHHFGNLVASKLRAYDADVRCLIQSDILKLFVRANKGYYNDAQDFPNVSTGPRNVHSDYPAFSDDTGE